MSKTAPHIPQWTVHNRVGVGFKSAKPAQPKTKPLPVNLPTIKMVRTRTNKARMVRIP